MRLFVLCISLLAPSAVLFTQTDSIEVRQPVSFGTIDTIIIVGNEKTKESVILREMTLKPGMEATHEAMEFDRGRIYSIGLFTSVDISPVPFEGKNLLVIDVKERWYIIPLPIFGFRDGDPKKPFYGAGLLHNNFRGLNQKLFGSIVFGYNPSLAFQFSDPWIDRDNNLYFSGGLSFSRIRNKSTVSAASTGNFDEFHYDINTTLGKRLTLYNNVGVNLGYQIVEVTEYQPGRTVAGNGSDRFLYGSISFSHDSRNLRDYSTRGAYVSLYITKYGFGESELSFTRLGADIRCFQPLPFSLTFAERVHGSIVSGSVIPTYVRSYFGYGERIRGYFNDVFEGENIAGMSVEFRWQVLQPRIVKFEAISLPQEFSIWRLGLSLELFVDAGTTWFRGEPFFPPNNFGAGYGGGVVFLLPYDIIVRTEYALNDQGRGQFILGIRSSF